MPPRATRPAAPAARCTAPAAHCAAPRRAPPPPPPPPRRRPAYALFPAPPRPLPAAVRAVASAYAEEPLADAEKPPLVTLAEVYDVARSRGVALAFSTLGPAYRVVARDGSAEGEILGVTSGFIIPFAGLMHCDTLRVFTRGRGGAEGERLRGGASGLGLLLGGATFAYGLAAGCRTAEILAINDDGARSRAERLLFHHSHFLSTLRPPAAHPNPPTSPQRTRTRALCATTPTSASALCASSAAAASRTCRTSSSGAARGRAWTRTWRQRCTAGRAQSAARGGGRRPAARTSPGRELPYLF
jgi:hypothetical protein